jgi:RNA polymerase sigma factor (TIGR02999 family)
MGNVTKMLGEISSYEPQATESLFPLVYDELRRLAHRKLRHEKPGLTLQTTDLIHEAFLRLVGTDIPWENERHFFAAAAEAMRRILIELARRKQRQKHGGGRKRVNIEQACPATSPPGDDLLAINDAIEKLALITPEKVELVKLRFFAGMTIDEAAGALGISHATAERHWAYARAWLYCELNRGAGQSNEPKKLTN